MATMPALPLGGACRSDQESFGVPAHHDLGHSLSVSILRFRGSEGRGLPLASCPARQGQQRSLRRMRQDLSWALARSPGARSRA
jgi:hypothetical protein